MGGTVSQPTPQSPKASPALSSQSQAAVISSVPPILSHSQYLQALHTHTTLSKDVIALVLSYLRPLPLVVCLGGHNGIQRLLSFDVYDPNTELWSATYFPPLPVPHFYTKLSAMLCSSTDHTQQQQLYVMSDQQKPGSNCALRFDVGSRQWQEVPGFTQYRRFPAAAAFDGKHRVLGSVCGVSILSECHLLFGCRLCVCNGRQWFCILRRRHTNR